jgi:itaconyl-CoA hydratase
MTGDPRHHRDLGRFYEDFEVGDVFDHPLGRTIDAADNRWLTLLTMNTNEAHFNADMAARTEFGREIVNSGLTLALVLGLTVSDVSQNAVANLGWTDITLRAPVFVGDTLYAQSVITARRDSASRPDCGIIGTFSRGINADGVDVLTFSRTVLVARRSRGAAVRSFPRARTPLASYLPGQEGH